MSRPEFSSELIEFIFHRIQSVSDFEVLILLAKNSGRAWLVHEISAELRTSERSALVSLELLGAAGLVLKSEKQPLAFQFNSRSRDAKLVHELLHLYPIFYSRLVRLIYERPNHTLQRFADAFRIRRED
ncbi:MAG TPA: hypothetical protein VFV50_18250 [Bdellovibrionales bacterium]|nr:hypothetical protein [Bdellovibrionales bacterium]